MKTSIRTAYRVVITKNDGKNYFVPQYQEENNPNFHNFRIPLSGRTGGHNDIYFDTLNDAQKFLETEETIEDRVAFTWNWSNKNK
jgi:hypothetical protein